jgi:hypothetical protein
LANWMHFKTFIRTNGPTWKKKINSYLLYVLGLV